MFESSVEKDPNWDYKIPPNLIQEKYYHYHHWEHVLDVYWAGVMVQM